MNGAIHNPHYFEYLRAANGGVMPRNPGDIPCIANLPNAWQFERDIVRRFQIIPAELSGFLYGALNTITHIQQVEIPSQTNHAQDMDNTEANVQYLNHTYTEERWKQVLQQREKRRIKRDEVRMRYEAFVGACVDIYGRIMAQARNYPTPKAVDSVTLTPLLQEAVTQVHSLCTIFNDGMMDLSKRYKCQVLQLQVQPATIKRETKKFDCGRLRRVKKSDGSTIGSSEQEEEEQSDVIDTVSVPLRTLVRTISPSRARSPL
jgi:hypothetical protein